MRKVQLRRVLVVFLVSISLCGCDAECYEELNTEIVTEECTTETSTDCVNINSIEKPVMGEAYLTVCNEDTGEIVDVVYATDGEYVLDFKSGFPGFGYSIISHGSTFSLSEKVSLNTNYGRYEYVYVDTFDFDSVNCVIDKDKFNLGMEEEKLFLCDEQKGTVLVYEYVSGTKILVD